MISRRNDHTFSTNPAGASELPEERGSAVLRIAARTTPRQALPFVQRAVVALERGDAAAAESMLRRALYLAPDFAEALYHLGVIQARRSDRQNARRTLLAALRASERHPPQTTLSIQIAEELAGLLTI